jgi:hypothetical protein
MRIVVFSLIFVFSTVLQAQETKAVEKDSYVIKGVGAALCRNYTQAVNEKDEQRFIFGGFLQGYITGLNESLSNVFDITPWQNDRTLGLILYKYCVENPTQQFVFAVGRVLISFNTDVLTQPSPLKPVDNVQPIILLRESVMQQIIERLNRLGYGNLAGNTISKNVQVALKAFQEKEGLEASGVPDQETLLRLFARDQAIDDL